LTDVTDDPTQPVAPMTPETLLDMASGLALVAEAWTHSLERYPDARTGLRILATESYDVWLLRWPAGTAVSPHHHGDSDAAFVVSSGALKETRWLEGRREERQLTRGKGATVERGIVHDVGAQVEALSVHVYSPPLVRMAFFDDQAEKVLLEEPVEASHDAVVVSGSSIIDHSGGLETILEKARQRISPRIEPRDLAAAVDLGALVVDTRPADLRQREGELEGAVVIDRNVLEWRLDPYGSHRIQEASDADRPVILVCDEGYASSLAAVSLLDLGRRNVTDLKGGYQAWKVFTQCQAVASSTADEGPKVNHPRRPTRGRSMRVEDVIFLDDLRALGIPWIDRLVGPCTSLEDVERLWTLVRMWGPDHEDAKDVLQLSAQLPHLEQEAEKMLGMIRLCENYRR
jgi:rhodanese-related sulfurtransferase/quercetin dioxygenase-like cupin family protein